jgi:hypothetical protein
MYLTVASDGIVLRVSFPKRLWLKGPTYQGSTEDEDEDEAVTEAVTVVVIEVEAGDTALIGPVVGKWMSVVVDASTKTGCSAGEDAATNYYFLEF